MKIIANPAAGHGKSSSNLDQLRYLLRQRGVSYDLRLTEAPGHATRLARELVQGGTSLLVVMGGDGTIGEVIHGMIPSQSVLGIISVGTGNDLARTLGIPFNDVAQSLDIILSGKVRLIDVGWERDRHFVLVLGLGFPATVAEEANQMKWLKGSPAFFGAVYKALFRMQEIPIRLSLDEQVMDVTCTSVLIQNARYCGGGQLMAPDAEIDDGMFDVVLVGPIGKWSLMRNFPKVYTGRHLRHPAFSVVRARSVRIESQNPLPKMLDGDLVGTTPVEAHVLHRSLKVLVR
ncbi:MAG: diacylglycerol kinase family lipid kinase [Acidobacteria bacterium]|nr:diacylglycerol kinase family lipid kinase [Acidobacteriota bacterium]